MASTFHSGAKMRLFLSVFILAGEAASFKFNIHHRFSDLIKGILGSEGLPEKHTPGYHGTMVHRDRLLHGRRLATTNGDTPLTFSYGDETYNLDSLGILYYANVSVGTPELFFIVALDTGSDLFWLPCECRSCRTYLNTRDGGKFMLNQYSPNASTTSAIVPCSNSLCKLANQCNSNKNTCPYKTHYVSSNATSAGYLVQDVLHLATDDSQLKPVDAKITLGCGKVQTGRSFTRRAAPNGLIGLGMEKISVPSFLASQGLPPDSFSMCFGIDGLGRIDFGDIGPSGQRETPLNTMSSSYNVTFIQIIVIKPTNVEFTAIFDSGSSYTYLTDPIYFLVTKKIDAAMKLERFPFDSDFPFEYCYLLSPETLFSQPTLNFTMKGGYNYGVTLPLVDIPMDDGSGDVATCLAIVKSPNINIIGQNFMAGNCIVFNREKMVLGWKDMDGDDNGAGTPSGKSPPSDSPPTDDSPPSATLLRHPLAQEEATVRNHYRELGRVMQRD